MPITILIAEANPIELVGLRTVLHRATGVRVVAEASSPAALFKLTDEHRPRVIILGEELLKAVGSVLLEELQRRQDPPAVLVLGQEESAGAVERMLSAGAAGFLARTTPVEELLHGIQRAAAGDPAVSTHLLARILRRRHHPVAHEPPPDPTALLSQRELEILRLTGLGMEAKEVAGQLKVSPRTVDVHRANIRRKLGIQGMHHLMRYAMRWLEHWTPDSERDAFAGATRPVLLVEDDEVDILSVKRSFQELALDTALRVVRSADEALAFLREPGNPRPSLILLDIKMPGMDGGEFLAELRRDPRLSLSPVVVLTTSRDEADMTRMYALGIAAYLVKPTAARDFTEMMRNLMRFWAMSEKPPPPPAD
jgi:DNA-binding NarL/FixJ family response regulator